MPTPEELAEFVKQRAKDNPAAAQAISDVQMFDGLRDHIGWRRLYEKVMADKERYMAKLARRLMEGEKDLEEEILFHRAFYYGAEWILGHPEEAAKSLEQAARRAYNELTVLEELSTQEGDEPYA